MQPPLIILYKTMSERGQVIEKYFYKLENLRRNLISHQRLFFYIHNSTDRIYLIWPLIPQLWSTEWNIKQTNRLIGGDRSETIHQAGAVPLGYVLPNIHYTIS